MFSDMENLKMGYVGNLSIKHNGESADKETE